jgi:cyclomaltodextrin glucanotransferase
MMESWDNASHPFQLVKTLLRLRENNQALAYGSHNTAWVNENFYLYTRNYRGSAVMVMVNKSEHEHVVNAQHIRMPDGDHVCHLTGRTVSLSNGQLQGFGVPAKTAMVVSVAGQPVQGQVVAVFQLNGFETQPGQSVAIVGSCDELGNWHHDQAYGMEYLNQNTWIASVAFDHDAARLVNFKFLVKQQGAEPIIEYVINRKLLLPEQGTIAVDCFWNAAA